MNTKASAPQRIWTASALRWCRGWSDFSVNPRRAGGAPAHARAQQIGSSNETNYGAAPSLLLLFFYARGFCRDSRCMSGTPRCARDRLL